MSVEYQEALKLRKNKDYTGASVLLKTAASLGHPLALWDLYKAYYFGGWGIQQDNTKAVQTYHVIQKKTDETLEIIISQNMELLLDGAQSGNVSMITRYATSLCQRKQHADAKIWFELGSKEGDVECVMWLYSSQMPQINDMLIEGHAQLNCRCTYSLFNLHWEQGNYKKACVVYLQNPIAFKDKYLITKAHCNPVAMYHIGRVTTNTEANSFYKRVNKNVISSVIAWLITARRLGLYKDVARVIGKFLFITRETDPESWDWENKIK